MFQSRARSHCDTSDDLALILDEEIIGSNSNFGSGCYAVILILTVSRETINQKSDSRCYRHLCTKTEMNAIAQWVTQEDLNITYVSKLGQGGYGEVHKVCSLMSFSSNAQLRNLKTHEVRGQF